MVSLCLCVLWALIVTMLVPNEKQPAGIIISAIGALLISIICYQLGIK